MRHLLHILTCAAILNCKPNTPESAVKTLDNYADGKRTYTNQCAGDTEIKAIPEVKKRIQFFKKRAVYDKGETREAELSRAIEESLSAVPIHYLDALRTLKGDILVTGDVHKLCTAQLQQIANDLARQSKKDELKALMEDRKAVDHCYLFLPELAKKDAAPPLALVVKNDPDIVRHALVRTFGYFLGSHLSHIEFGAKSVSYYPDENPWFRESIKTPLAVAFLQDIQAGQNEAHKERFRQYFDYQNVPAQSRNQLEDFVFAEAFDSYHCNNHSPDDRLNTQVRFIAKFPGTFAAFIKMYDKRKSLFEEQATSTKKRKRRFVSGGANLTGFGLLGGGRSWWQATKDFGSGYTHYFKKNTGTAAKWTKDKAVATGTVVKKKYDAYSSAVQTKTQAAVDAVAATKKGEKLGVSDYAGAIVYATGQQVTEETKTAAKAAKESYQDYSKRVGNTTTGVIDTMAEVKGEGNLSTLDYASAVTYATARHGGKHVWKSWDVALNSAEALGGATYDLDEEGNVTGGHELSKAETKQRWDHVKEVVAKEAVYHAAVAGVTKSADKLHEYRNAGTAGEEAIQAANTAKNSASKVTGPCLTMGPCDVATGPDPKLVQNVDDYWNTQVRNMDRGADFDYMIRETGAQAENVQNAAKWKIYADMQSGTAPKRMTDQYYKSVMQDVMSADVKFDHYGQFDEFTGKVGSAMSSSGKSYGTSWGGSKESGVFNRPTGGETFKVEAGGVP